MARLLRRCVLLTATSTHSGAVALQPQPAQQPRPRQRHQPPLRQHDCSTPTESRWSRAGAGARTVCRPASEGNHEVVSNVLVPRISANHQEARVRDFVAKASSNLGAHTQAHACIRIDTQTYRRTCRPCLFSRMYMQAHVFT